MGEANLISLLGLVQSLNGNYQAALNNLTRGQEIYSAIGDQRRPRSGLPRGTITNKLLALPEKSQHLSKKRVLLKESAIATMKAESKMVRHSCSGRLPSTDVSTPPMQSV